MAASWEIQAGKQVLVVILTREMSSTAWAFGFRNLIIPGTYTGLSGMPFDHARNVGCKKVLENGFEWLFFLDDDIIAPPDTIPRLMAHKQPIVSGLYYRRNSPIVPVMLRKKPEGTTWVTEFKVPDLIEVDYVGAGCLLIHNSVLRKLPPINQTNHYFDWRVDRVDLPEKERISEDFAFNDHAQKHGYKILVDTSIGCKHCGLSESKMPGTLEPLALM